MNEQIKQAALNAANEIADDFVIGFCDDRMVEHFAAHIEKHITKLLETSHYRYRNQNGLTGFSPPPLKRSNY